MAGEGNPGAGRLARLALPALLLGAVGIGFAPIFVRVSELAPTATAFHRAFLAVPVLWLWCVLERRRHPEVLRPAERGDIAKLILAGLCFAGDLAAFHWSIVTTSVANAALLLNFMAIFVTLGAWMLFRERPKAVFLAGLATALAGAGVLMGESLNLSARQLGGDALGLLAALFYAGYILIVGRLRPRFSTATIMLWTTAPMALALIPVVWISGENVIPQTANGLALLIGLALVSHVAGQGLVAYGLAQLPAAFGSVVLLFAPAVSALLAWALLAEPLSWTQILGGLIVLAGIELARRGSR
ncbi:MAG: DMT family transporter [Rhodospirillales bacterium]|nr:DMT family transporter [Rhodospirillales bacterium]MSP79524.1 DMT family transporter [Rhodospirillales bacterium]